MTCNKLQNYYHKILDGNTRRTTAPLSVQINIDNTCINSCAYCKKKTFPQVQMSLEKVLSLLKEFKDMGVQTVIFSGGEPFLHADLLTMLSAAKSHGLGVSVITSGQVVPRNLSEYVENIDKLNVSLDAVNASVFKRTRGNGDVDLVKDFIIRSHKLVDFKKQQLNVWTVDSKLNHFHVAHVKKFVAKNAPRARHEVFSVKTHKDFGASDVELSFKECPYNFFFAIVDASGLVMSCCKLFHDNDDFATIKKDLILGNVSESSFREVWESYRAQQIRNKIFVTRFNECRGADRCVGVNSHFKEFCEKSEKVYL